METKTQHGYLVLADISGYTSFLAGTELEHAHEILTELLEVIVHKFETLLTISKLEGDAVFAYIPEAKVPRGELLLDLIDSTYLAFRDQVAVAHRRTTCTCSACRAIPTLDLKFMAHHGDFIQQHIGERLELVGSDVNLIHRLLKNHVSEQTGWKAYTLLTRKCLERLQVEPTNLHEGKEGYEHLGEVQTLTYDLRKRYEEMSAARNVVIEPERSQLTLTMDYPLTPPVLWDWLNDPHKRATYTLQDNLRFETILRPQGRNGVGARNHCIHGKDVAMIENVLDWKPFNYITVEQGFAGIRVIFQYILTPLEDGKGTRLEWRILNDKLPLPGFVNRFLTRTIMTRVFPLITIMKNLEKRIAEDLERQKE
jgi:hypothetical protein